MYFACVCVNYERISLSVAFHSLRTKCSVVRFPKGYTVEH